MTNDSNELLEIEAHYKEVSMIINITRPEIKNVNVRKGSEGPTHDPYSFTEYSVNGLTLHLGLGTWLKTTDNSVNIKNLSRSEDEDKIMIKIFEKVSKCTLEEIDWYQNAIYIEDPMGRLEDYE